eukprot:3238252-Amphidinium_carterae.1
MCIRDRHSRRQASYRKRHMGLPMSAFLAEHRTPNQNRIIEKNNKEHCDATSNILEMWQQGSARRRVAPDDEKEEDGDWPAFA